MCSIKRFKLLLNLYVLGTWRERTRMISKLTTLMTAGPNDEDSDDESFCEDTDYDFDEKSYHRQV